MKVERIMSFPKTTTLDKSTTQSTTELHSLHEKHEAITFPSLSFVATAPGKYEWQQREVKKMPGSDEARVDVWFELPSVGTFSAKDRGTDIKLNGHFDEDNLYVEGEPAEAFPLNWGYAESGVVKVSNSTRVNEGKQVSGTMQFNEDFTGDANRLYEVNPEIREELVPLVKHIMPIVLGSVLSAVDSIARKDNITEDELRQIIAKQGILVTGAGPLGLIAAKSYQALNAEKVMITDVDPKRDELAEKMGIDAIQTPNTRDLDEKEAAKIMYQFNKAIKREFPERGEEDERHGSKSGPDIVNEWSGAAAALNNALNMVRDHGRIINAGYSPLKVPLDLGTRAHHFGISIIPAQVGYISEHQKKNLPDRPKWDRDRLSKLGETILLAEDPSFTDGRKIQDTIADNLITHLIPFDKAPETYHDLMKNNQETLDALKPYARGDGDVIGYALYYSGNVPEYVLDRLGSHKYNDNKSNVIDLKEFSKKKERIRLELAKGYSVEVADGFLTVRNEQGKVMFENAFGSIELTNGTQISTKSAEKKVTATEKGGVRIETPGTSEQAGLSWEITPEKNRPGLRIVQEVYNTTEKEMQLNRFILLDMPEGLGVPTDQERASGVGYQSWSEPIHRKVSKLNIQKHHIYLPQVDAMMDRGQIIPEAAHIKVDGEEKQVLIGFLPSAETSRHHGIVELHNKEQRITGWNAAEGVTLEPQGRRKSEELLVLFDDDRNNALESHARELAKRVGFEKVKNERPFVGICTWSWAFGKLQPQDVRGSLEKTDEIKAEGINIDLMQIDDLGTARYPHGYWFEELDHFLRDEFGGLKGFVDAVHAKDEEAGVWIAPGFVNEKSPLHASIMQKGGDGYVKDADGRPMMEKHEWEGQIEHQYLLDMTHPEVQDHMRKQFQKLADAGVDYIKLDFLYNLMAPGQRYKKDATSVEAYNEFLTLFKDVWGDRKVNACGAPFYKTAGLWSIRGGADVLADNAPQWYHPMGKDRLSGGAAQNSVNANFMRLFVLDEIYQRIDPDSTVTRLTGDSRLTPAEVQSIVASNRMGNDALITIGDDPRSLTEKQIELLKFAIAPGEASRPIAFDNGHPVIAERMDDNGVREMTIMNWEDKENKIIISDYELPAAADIQDIFTGEHIDAVDGDIEVEVPPHGAKVLKIA